MHGGVLQGEDPDNTDYSGKNFPNEDLVTQLGTIQIHVDDGAEGW
jgi:hypothetical protein